MSEPRTTGEEERPVVAISPVAATRARMLGLHRRGLITLGLPEDDPSPRGAGNTAWPIVITTGFRDEHKLIGVLVGAEVARPGTHPMAETFHVVAHAQVRDPWYLFGFDHPRVEPVRAARPELASRGWEQLTPEERRQVERANKERLGRGEVDAEDMFCLEFGPDAPAELLEYVVFSMPSSTIHGELRRPLGTGRPPRFYVDELDLKALPEGFSPVHGPTWFTLAEG